MEQVDVKTESISQPQIGRLHEAEGDHKLYLNKSGVPITAARVYTKAESRVPDVPFEREEKLEFLREIKKHLPIYLTEHKKQFYHQDRSKGKRRIWVRLSNITFDNKLEILTPQYDIALEYHKSSISNTQSNKARKVHKNLYLKAGKGIPILKESSYVMFKALTPIGRVSLDHIFPIGYRRNEKEQLEDTPKDKIEQPHRVIIPNNNHSIVQYITSMST